MPPSDASGPGRPDSSLAVAMVIEELAEVRLRRSAHPSLAAVRCVYRDGSLTLLGRLPSEDLKRAAEACVSGVVGVREVRNQIEVAGPADRRTP
jgi:osmotically-inducible protein OsmY